MPGISSSVGGFTFFPLSKMPFLPSPNNAVLALSRNRACRIKEEPVLNGFVQSFPLEARLLLGPAHCWIWSGDGRFQAPGTIRFVWDCLGRERLCSGSSREQRAVPVR